MKTVKFFFFSMLLFSFVANAQYGTSQYGNNYGRSRTNQFPQSSPSKPSAEDIEKAKSERIDKIMAKLKDELNLDELQFIAIKNEIISNNKSIDIVMKRESDEDKNNDIKAIQEKSEKTIISYLNPVQKEKFLKLKEDSAQNKKEDKKEKRGKKDREVE